MQEQKTSIRGAEQNNMIRRKDDDAMQDSSFDYEGNEFWWFRNSSFRYWRYHRWKVCCGVRVQYQSTWKRKKQAKIRQKRGGDDIRKVHSMPRWLGYFPLWQNHGRRMSTSFPSLRLRTLFLVLELVWGDEIVSIQADTSSLFNISEGSSDIEGWSLG